MKNTIFKFIALMLAIGMVATLAVGCGDNDNNSSIGSTDVLEEGGKVPGMLPEVKLEDYQGTTVRYASWKDPWANEDGDAIDKFEKEFGIKVEWVRTGESAGYVNEINATIAADKQADIYFQSNTFPGALTAMQPLDAAKLDLADPIWNQAIIKASTIEGHPYLVDALANVWSEIDICVYNKRLFEDNGITSPKEYYDAGKWTFANFRKAAMEISALGKEFTGATVLTEPILGAAGAAFFNYSDGKFTVTTDNHFSEVASFLSEMAGSGYLKRGREEFDNGKTGIAITNCFALKKTGYFTSINPQDIAATYLPVWQEGDKQQVSAIFRGWGLIDGAKNPVAAGIFLRQYLDSSNYNLEKAFHNMDVADFFFETTSMLTEDTEIVFNFFPDLVNTTGLSEVGEMDNIYWISPNQINKFIDTNKNLFNLMAEKANEVVEAERKWIKEQEAAGKLKKAE